MTNNKNTKIKIFKATESNEISINYDALGCVSCLQNNSNNVQKLTNCIFSREWDNTANPNLINLIAATNKSILQLEDDIIKLQVFLNSYTTSQE